MARRAWPTLVWPCTKVSNGAIAVPKAAQKQPVPSSEIDVVSWIVKNRLTLALGIGVSLFICIGLYFPLKWIAARGRARKAELGQQHRAARHQLKEIFDRIFIEGERPSGKNIPEGETLPIDNGHCASGSGRWFVIGPSYIWAVQDNGRDEDNWALNNVVTDGPGAIGARVMADPELADSIRTTAAAAR